MDNAIPLTLEEIANWQLKTSETTNSSVWAEIPSFQRGRVWSPAQIEVLWDSLMRGIPIGALSLLPIEGSERYGGGRFAPGKLHGFWVVDGQQRSTAIAVGFSEFPNVNEPILWLDINPDRSKARRRKYYFYVTTPGRPWGYGITNGNDERKSESVSTDEYRKVLFEELKWTSGLGSKPDTFKLWPVKAGLPVPFCELRRLKRLSVQRDGWLNELLKCEGGWVKHFEKILKEHADDEHFSERIKDEIEFALEGLDRVDSTKTIGLITTGSLSGDEQGESSEADENSNIAVYFSRLNQGGTSPKREDLDYSILKSILPELSALDGYAKELMHPSRMASIAMLTYASRQKWKGSIGRSEIYKLQFDENFKVFILSSSGKGVSPFMDAIHEVLSWIEFREDNDFAFPRALCSSLAKERPALFRLLILMARVSKNRGWVVDRRKIVAFVSLTWWFGVDSALDYASAYERLLGTQTFNDAFRILQGWAAQQTERGAFDIPPRVGDFEAIVRAAEAGDPDQIKRNRNPVGHGVGLNRIWGWTSAEGRAFLLYACRKYLEKSFHSYDPESAVWNEDDRPWDYDHIFPQRWLQSGSGNRFGDFHDVVFEFIMSIGNIAPVPFSLNRSWHDAPPREYLEDDNSLVYVDFRDGSGKPVPFSLEKPKHHIEDSWELACSLAYVTGRRWMALCEEWYKLPVDDFLSGMLDEERKERIDNYCEHLRNMGLVPRIVYHWVDGLQYDVVNPYDWSRPWLACGVTGTFDSGDKKIRCFLSIAINETSCYVGIRKHPEDATFNATGNDWADGWVYCGTVKEGADAFLSRFKAYFQDGKFSLDI